MRALCKFETSTTATIQAHQHLKLFNIISKKLNKNSQNNNKCTYFSQDQPCNELPNLLHPTKNRNSNTICLTNTDFDKERCRKGEVCTFLGAVN